MIFPSKYVGQFYHVARTLGEVVNGKLDTRLSTLCTSSKINQFSKWKPVNYDGIEINATILKNINYGLTITSASTVDQLVSLIDENGTHTYDRPIGGLKSPYRLGDFRNYNTNAPIPVMPMGARDIYNAGNATTMLINIGSEGDETTLGKNDLYYLTDESGNEVTLHRGIYMINANGNKAWCTDEIDWANIPKKTYWTTGEITCYDFYTNVQKTIGGVHTSSAEDVFFAIVSDRFNPNPYKWYLTGQEPAGSKTYYFTVTAILDSSGTSVSYRVDMSSVGDVYVGGSASNISIQLRTSLNGGTFVNAVSLDAQRYIGDEETYTWNGTMSIPPAYQGSTLFVQVYADNKLQVRSGIMTSSGGKE